MRQRVVILNGPAGVGKTSVGRLLAARSPSDVCIQGDALADFIVIRDAAAVDLGLAYVNGATLAANDIRAGYELVVFEYCFEEQAHIQRFLDAYDAGASVSVFTLWASKRVIARWRRTWPSWETSSTIWALLRRSRRGWTPSRRPDPRGSARAPRRGQANAQSVASSACAAPPSERSASGTEHEMHVKIGVSRSV